MRLTAEGKGVKPVARELGIDPKTVRAVLHPKPPRPPKPRPSQLDPFRPLIRKLVLEDELSAERVIEEIRACGYPGQYTILTDYIRTFRPKARTRPHLRFETDPGVQAQVDLSPYTVLIGEQPTSVVCFSLVLGYSRWQFIRFTLRADAHSVSHSHVLAFEAMGGVPHTILYDRMKQVVVHSYRDEVVFHDLFAALVVHYGFKPVPLAPGYCEGKGKVENPFRFVEGNFLAGRKFHDMADLQAQAEAWLRKKWEREHRTTREPPSQRLERERPHLLALPTKAFEAAVVLPRLIGDDFCVAWETNRYSVPPRFAGRQAWVRVLEGRLEVRVDAEVIAAHDLRSSQHKRYMAPEHEAQFRQHSTSGHVLKEQFLRLGSVADAFARGLKQERGGAAGYHMSQILKLADRVGVVRVAEALRHAERYGAFDYSAVIRIVEGKPARATVELQPRALTPQNLGPYLKGTGSYQRSPDHYQKLSRDRHTEGEGKGRDRGKDDSGGGDDDKDSGDGQ